MAGDPLYGALRGTQPRLEPYVPDARNVSADQGGYPRVVDRLPDVPISTHHGSPTVCDDTAQLHAWP